MTDATVVSLAGASRACSTRLGARARRFRHSLVVILYGHARYDQRPSKLKLARFLQARRKVSWTASSASSKEPSIR
ncbi:MAG: hypothetical protein ACR2KP_15915 [Egibacteraceae bacterium]